MKKIDKKIMFEYYKDNNRTSCDCWDLYNWLLDRNVKIAKEFEKLIKKVTKTIIKQQNEFIKDDDPSIWKMKYEQTGKGKENK